MRTDEELVLAARAGEPEAFGSLVERWTDRCWNIAWRILHDRELAADVAQDALLTAWQRLDRLEQPASFGGWVSRIARNRALDRLEQERRAVATGDHDALEAAAVGSVGAAVGGASVGDPVAALDSAQQQDLVWAAAAALGERDASVLDLHLRHGLEPRELAEELGIAPNNAHQVLFRLRQRLGGAIRAWLLWRGGRPRCERLSADLSAAGVEVFGAAAVRVIDAHADDCVACDGERTAVVAPAAMFSAVPLAAMPAALGARVMAGLQAAGVPVPAGAASGGGVAGDAAEAEGAGDAAEAEGAGDAAEAAGAGAGGDSAEAAGAGDAAEAAAGADGPAEVGDGDAPPGGGGLAAHLKVLVGVGLLAMILLWSALADDAPSEVEEIAAAPEEPAEPAPPLEAPEEAEPIVDVAPLPPVPGGQDDPAVVPVVPPGPWGPSVDLDGPDDPAGAPEADDPPEQAPPPAPEPPPTDRDPNGNSNGEDEEDEEDPPAPTIPVLTASVITAAPWCEPDELGVAVTWEAEHAESVELRTNADVYPGLPTIQDRYEACVLMDPFPYEVTLVAFGPEQRVSRTEEAQV